ncbi:MAG: hypothetical protein QN141_01595 [Armatimonadota bacterium]|nr:hypothetical protein [Armatimonadota bacterium]MDR7451025.1 hypothetical protein [Armatimonadota bacterium]MDR7465954.1 hypothetical protein [Armatimonadota bacterium]MDR7494019.1 hypothetical protein [Armatimonadota bacterium]MDR7498469.1 hypothetical protein [Armatimonadota bacterium]
MRSDGGTRIRVETTGPLWFIGWLFTIAFAQLVWWKAILALIFWPYYLGLVLR